MVESSPSSPWRLSPQHSTAPAEVRAQACCAPTVTAWTPRGEADDFDRGEATGRGIVAELARAVVPPALDHPGVRKRARARASRGDGLDAGGEAVDIDGDEAVAEAVVAELARTVDSPALDASRGGEAFS